MAYSVDKFTIMAYCDALLDFVSREKEKWSTAKTVLHGNLKV